MKLATAQSKKIQQLRGLAIIAVVLIHNAPSGLIQVYFRPFLNFSVGLFLFLSGMLSDLSKWNPWKRIKKVVIPYVLWTLIYSIMHGIEAPASIPVAFIKNLLTGNAAVMMYYIFVYCELTLLVPVVDRMARSRFKYWFFLISPIEIILMRTIPIITGLKINTYISTIMGISCLGWFVFFYLGYLIGNQLLTVNITSKKIILLWIISVVFQVAEGYCYYTIGYANCGTQLKVTSVITGMLFALMAYNYIKCETARNIKALEFLGDNSFGIYFSHIAVMLVMGQFSAYRTYVGFPASAVITLALTVLCIIIGKRILGKYSSYLAL